jgi:hypothetical protein
VGHEACQPGFCFVVRACFGNASASSRSLCVCLSVEASAGRHLELPLAAGVVRRRLLVVRRCASQLPLGSATTRLSYHSAQLPLGSATTRLSYHPAQLPLGSATTRLSYHSAQLPLGSAATRLSYHSVRSATNRDVEMRLALVDLIPVRPHVRDVRPQLVVVLPPTQRSHRGREASCESHRVRATV